MIHLKRRSFVNSSLSALSLAISFNGTRALAFAQPSASPTTSSSVKSNGQQYQKLDKRVATTAGDKKIEIVEFFWFGCPHCNALDPLLDAWLKKAPADVSFKRVHISFGERTDIHQRLFLTLETMGLNATQNGAVFTAIHSDRKKLNTRDDVMEWAKSRNLDLAKFSAIFDDRFTMMRKQAAAAQLQAAYKVEGVPHFGVDGQYITSPSMAKSETGFFNTLDFLIQTVRKDRGGSAATGVVPDKLAATTVLKHKVKH
jgi:protein dithiol oxidoreductase (disulfide-forming)